MSLAAAIPEYCCWPRDEMVAPYRVGLNIPLIDEVGVLDVAGLVIDREGLDPPAHEFVREPLLRIHEAWND
jgi:hypothetical protein